MTDHRQDNPNDRELWGRFVRAGRKPDAGGPCLDAGQLADYADGRAPTDQATRIEAHLAGCSRCLGALREVRQLLDEPPMTAPATLLARAKSLVRAKPAAPARHRGLLDIIRHRVTWQSVARWSAATAAAVLVGLAGFSAGSATVHNRQATEARVAAEISFESFIPAEDPLLAGADDLEMLLENGGVK